MRCIDHQHFGLRAAATIGSIVLGLGGCAQQHEVAQAASTPVAASAPTTVAASAPAAMSPVAIAAPASAAVATAAPPSQPGPHYVQLGVPGTPRNAGELRLQFARRLVAAHPDGSYSTVPPDRLLAIPVIETELNADGSVRRIDVLRKPSTGDEATLLAIAAIRRAAPYGDVSKLPRPWKVVETFLFDDDLRFKPRTLDVR